MPLEDRPVLLFAKMPSRFTDTYIEWRRVVRGQEHTRRSAGKYCKTFEKDDCSKDEPLPYGAPSATEMVSIRSLPSFPRFALPTFRAVFIVRYLVPKAFNFSGCEENFRGES